MTINGVWIIVHVQFYTYHHRSMNRCIIVTQLYWQYLQHLLSKAYQKAVPFNELLIYVRFDHFLITCTIKKCVTSTMYISFLFFLNISAYKCTHTLLSNEYTHTYIYLLKLFYKCLKNILLFLLFIAYLIKHACIRLLMLDFFK